MKNTDLDQDLEKLSREELLAEAKKLRAGIREHRDSSGQELCWYHPDLWNLLPDKTAATLQVPSWPEFMNGCVPYRQSLDKQLPEATRTNAAFQADVKPVDLYNT
jgi:hypothetical protein